MLKTGQAERRPHLTAGEYDRIFRVLEDCDTQATVSRFREALIEALARNLGFQHTTFFLGPSIGTAWMDPAPTVAGKTRGMLNEYQNGWYKHDVFRSGSSLRLLKAQRLSEIGSLRDLSGDEEQYIREFLNRGGLVSGYALALDVSLTHLGIVGIFLDEVADSQHRELELLKVLVRPLNALSRGLQPEAPSDDLRRRWQLAPRHWEVATLVADGLSNREIAHRLTISDDTVKKYVSAVLDALRCSSRTQAALIIREGIVPTNL